MVTEVKKENVVEQLVVFTLGEETYGVNISLVHEIIKVQEVTKIPRSPRFVEGIINLRGKVIPIIDLRKRFELPEATYTKNTRIIVIETDGHTIGTIVDSVSEVIYISADSIEPTPPVISGIDSEYLRGVGKLDGRLIILLDLNKLLTKNEKKELTSIG